MAKKKMFTKKELPTLHQIGWWIQFRASSNIPLTGPKEYHEAFNAGVEWALKVIVAEIKELEKDNA